MLKNLLLSAFVLLVALFAITLYPKVIKKTWPDEGFATRVYHSSDKGALQYRIHLPKNLQQGQRYPLVVFLHGSGERGSDNKQQLLLGVRDILSYCRSKELPAFIIAPQVPVGEKWVNVDGAADFQNMPQRPSASMQMLIGLLDELILALPVDKNRIYVTGLSMGGFGTWDLIERFPHRFAAAIPVCGGGDELMAPLIKAMPIWAFHGEKDPIVKTARSRNMIKAIRMAGGHPLYSEYPGVEHNAWDRAYKDQAVLSWLFEQHKN